MQLNRQVMVLGIIFGLPHYVFTLRRLKPLFFNTRHLVLRATFHALEPVSLRAYVVQALLFELPIIYLFSRASGLDVADSLFHLVLRGLVGAVIFYLRDIALRKITAAASSDKKKV